MRLQLHPNISVHALTIGAEHAPLLVIDNLVAKAEDLVGAAAAMPFSASARHYPGIRAAAPAGYQELLATRLGGLLASHFQIEANSVRFTMCHFSLITTPAEELTPVQRIPHIDSLGRDGLATIHYLFHRDLGGTAFYRHRGTGFEFVDEDRSAQYFETLEREQAAQTGTSASYINGDTDQFEKLSEQSGVFNRMLVYRRNSLHSGCIAADFVPDANPCTGRLSINSFIEFRR